MRFWQVFIKSIKEQSRDFMTLSLSLILAPLFVFVYWLFFPGGGSTTYDLLVLNHDPGPETIAGIWIDAGNDLIESLSLVTYSDGQPILDVKTIEDKDFGLASLKDRNAEILMIIPESFSQSVTDFQNKALLESAKIEFYGDLTNPYYAIAAVMASAGLEEYVESISEEISPIEINEFPIGDSAGRSEFELYVPGMLMFAVVLLVFQISMVVSYEVESGTFQRLKMSGVSAFEFLGGVSLSVLLIGVIGIILAFLTAVLLGFNSQGPIWAAVLVGSIACISIIGIGLTISAFTKTVAQSFILANFPLVVLMFFTGIIYPVQSFTIITIAGRDIGIFDFLPPTHAVNALNKILTLGVGLNEIWFEISALIFLSIVYFGIGVFLFKKRQMPDW